MAFRDLARKVWQGPFMVGPLQSPVSTGDAILKVLEVVWKGGVVLATTAASFVVIGVSITAYQDFSRPSLPDYEVAKERVRVTINYDAAACGVDAPLRTKIINNSRYRMMRYEINISAKDPGYSRNLAVPPLFPPNSDFIIEPAQASEFCLKVPELREEGLSRVASLVFTGDLRIGWLEQPQR